MEELASAKRSHNAHKGIFSQRIKAFESRVASFKRSPEVPQNWTEVEDAFEKVKLSVNVYSYNIVFLMCICVCISEEKLWSLVGAAGTFFGHRVERLAGWYGDGQGG